MGLRSRLKKLRKRVKRTVKSVWRVGVEYPLKSAGKLAQGDIKGATKYVRLAGRQQLFGIRAREIAAAAGLAYGGYAAYSIYSGSAAGVATGSTAAAVGGGGVASVGAGTAATGTAVSSGFATSLVSTLGSVAKTAATFLGLSQVLGLRNPGMGPESLPQENVWNGLTPAMYGGNEIAGAPLGFGASAPSASSLYDENAGGFGGLGGIPPMILIGLALFGVAAYFILRK